MVSLTSSTFSLACFLSAASGGKICVSAASEVRSSSCPSELCDSSTLCDYSMRIPPSSSFSGRTSALNLMR